MAALAARRRKGGTRFVPPKTAEDAVPVRRIWPDGVCLTDDGEYAKTWRVSDVNYAAASKEDKEAMFLGYSDLLNSFDSDARAKVTVAVRRLDAEALGRRILIPVSYTHLDVYKRQSGSRASAKRHSTAPTPPRCARIRIQRRWRRTCGWRRSCPTIPPRTSCS